MADRKYREILQNLVLMIIFILIFILLLEIFLRIFYAQFTLAIVEEREKTLNIFKDSEYLPWELNPGSEVRHIGSFNEWDVTVKINSKKLREHEINYTKPVGTYRLLVVGDSFTFGYGVELNETYPKVIEKLLLSNYPAKNSEVINAGYASGASIDTAYLFLKNEGLKYEPDMVIFGYLPGNDLLDIMEHQWYVDDKGLPVLIKIPSIYVNEEGNRQRKDLKDNPIWLAHMFLSKHSHAYTFFKNGIKNSIGLYVRRLFEPKTPSIYNVNYTGTLESGWEKTKTILFEISKLLRQRGIKFVVVYIPERHQAIDKFWNQYLYVSGQQENLVIRTKPEDMLKEFSLLNITVVDLYPAFHHNNSESLYFKIDPHWTKEGHYLAGHVVYTEIFNG